MQAKQKKSRKNMIMLITAVVLIAVIGVANFYVERYRDLLDVYFSTSDYQVTLSEKEVCQQVVADGIVLLKNEDGALPLGDRERKVVLLGQDAVDFVYGGAGSGSVDTSAAPSMKTAFEAAGFTVNQTLWDFYTAGAGKGYRKTTPDESGKGVFGVNEVPMSVYTDAVRNSLKDDDVAICVIGRSGGESSDLPLEVMESGYRYLEIDGNEQAMIQLACENFNKVILIVNANNAMELGFLEDPAYANVKAALWVGGVGQEGMHAIPQVLAGDVNPSGRLVDTYAYHSTSAPSFRNMGNFSIVNSQVTNGQKYLVYQEGIYIGYRYYETRYEDAVLGTPNVGDFDYAAQVQYPFGYGLSYTEFDWSGFKVTPSADGKTFTAAVTVKNTGRTAGKDVVQIYGQAPYTDYDRENGVEKSAIVLLGYAKTGLLKPGASETVQVSIDKKQFASYDDNAAKTYILDAGNYYIAAGRNAHDALNNVLAQKAKDGVTVNQATMTAAGDLNMTYSFTQDALDTTTYAVASNDYPIENRFDDVRIENYDPDFVFLSRSDWTGTFPQEAYRNGAWEAGEKMLADLEFFKVPDDPQAVLPPVNSETTSYTVQDLIGADYDDPRWLDMVNQLSWAQRTNLIRKGGYSTIQIDRIALPKTMDKDGPSGISGSLVGGTSCMAWPVEAVMASTWNDSLIETVGRHIGEDSIASKVAGWYAPGVDIHRSPYSGRNFEYYSEDGLLSGRIGAAEMRGVRSKGVMAYMKHFALNDQETNRYGGAVFSREQEIRELSIKGFEIITEESKPTALMVAMNRIGTRWAGAHKGLMTDILRSEWGFQGMAITDQASTRAMAYQDMVSGLWAGTDMWLNTDDTLWTGVKDNYKENPTIATYVQRSAKNIIYAVTNSNAVQTYDAEEGKEATAVQPANTQMPTWGILRIAITAGLGIAALALLIIPCLDILKKKRKG